MVFRRFRAGRGKKALLWGLLMTGVAISGLSGLGEKTLVLGAAAGWDLVERRVRVTEVPLIRTNPVLALLPERSGREGPGAGEGPGPDMAVSFDEGECGLFADRTGNYRLAAGPSLTAAGQRWARAGTGAGLFSGAYSPIPVGTGGPLPAPALTVLPRTRGALLAPGARVRDFSIEFWLYPFNAEAGEQLVAWTSTREEPGEGHQRLRAEILRSRLQWSFTGFFTLPGGEALNLTLSPHSPLIPQTWSHHLLRFDADTGLLEYLVNGAPEGIRYATSTGREGGEVYTPVIGRGGELVLGGHYTGLMDEFRTYGAWVEAPALGRYPREGGRIETRPLDLGANHTGIVRVDARGGKFSLGESRGKLQNDYAGAGDLRFSGQGDLEFFIRAGDNPYGWTESAWLPLLPGRPLPETLRGRFVQLAAVFYPGGDGETSPYLDEIRIVYRTREPIPPPAALSAVARDGAVELSWRMSEDPELGGYLVYYGGSPGEYFGDAAILGPSPINVGKRGSIRIDGLRNGTLYYFVVAAYDKRDAEPGEFSRELSARPLRMVE